MLLFLFGFYLTWLSDRSQLRFMLPNKSERHAIAVVGVVIVRGPVVVDIADIVAVAGIRGLSEVGRLS